MEVRPVACKMFAASPSPFSKVLSRGNLVHAIERNVKLKLDLSIKCDFSGGTEGTHRNTA